MRNLMLNHEFSVFRISGYNHSPGLEEQCRNCPENNGIHPCNDLPSGDHSDSLEKFDDGS